MRMEKDVQGQARSARFETYSSQETNTWGS